MRYGNIPGIDKPVSRLVQGTANTVFDASKPEQAFGLLDMAMEYGINTFDTAHVYGEGNETTLGNWVRERGVRDKIVILAKGAHPYGGRNRVTPEDIQADLTESLSRQKLDYFAVMPWSSMAGGFFSDTYHRDNLQTFPADDYFAQICIKCYCGDLNFERLDRARELAQSKNLTVAQIALAFTASQPMNLFPLVSSLTEGQFAANAAAIEMTLTPQELAYLDLKN